MEIPKQHWRFEMGRTPNSCKIFLNDEQWFNVQWCQIEAGFSDRNTPVITTLTLRLFPTQVTVDMDPSAIPPGDRPDGLFGPR